MWIGWLASHPPSLPFFTLPLLSRFFSFSSLFLLPLTSVSSLLRWDVGTSGHGTFTRVPCRGHSHRSVTGASRQLDRGYGTACRLRSDGKTLLLNIIGGYWRRICSFMLRRIVTFLLKFAGYKYSYSLTHSSALLFPFPFFPSLPPVRNRTPNIRLRVWRAV